MKVLMTLVVVLLLAGCAAVQGGAGQTPAEQGTTANGKEEETTAYKEETTVPEAGGNLPRPPDSTLSYGGQEVKGTLGSYCWFSGGSGVCADSVFITPPRKKTLTVPSDSEMVFRYGGQSPPKTVEAGAYPLDKQGTSTARPTINRSRSLKTLGSGVERTIPVELPQGEYVVDVFLRVHRNDASYFFRIMVE
jgi:hypothetical protein